MLYIYFCILTNAKSQGTRRQSLQYGLQISNQAQKQIHEKETKKSSHGLPPLPAAAASSHPSSASSEYQGIPTATNHAKNNKGKMELQKFSEEASLDHEQDDVVHQVVAKKVHHQPPQHVRQEMVDMEDEEEENHSDHHDDLEGDDLSFMISHGEESDTDI